MAYVIARKGVLLSHPSVQEMSHMQWLIEAKALHKKEIKERDERIKLTKEVYEAASMSFRDILVHILGLNIGAGKQVEGKPVPFIPFMPLVAKPEVVEELMKRESEEIEISNALEDRGLSEVNDALMDLDMGDLEPIFSGKNSDDPIERWMSEDNQRALKEMGIEVKDRDPKVEE